MREDPLPDKTSELLRKTIPLITSASFALKGLAESATSAKLATAGVRGASRSPLDALFVAMKTPTATLGEATMKQTLKGYDWSHRVSHANGGSNGAFNGMWERASWNRARGGGNMTAFEGVVAKGDVLFNAMPTIARAGVASAAGGAAIAGAISLAHKMGANGTLNPAELEKDDWVAIGRDAAVGSGVSFAVTAICAAAPAATPVFLATGVVAASISLVSIARSNKEKLPKKEQVVAAMIQRSDNFLNRFS